MPIPRKATVCSRVPEKMKTHLEAIASYFDMTTSDVVVRLLRDGLDKFVHLSLPEMEQLLKPESVTIQDENKIRNILQIE